MQRPTQIHGRIHVRVNISDVVRTLLHVATSYVSGRR